MAARRKGTRLRVARERGSAACSRARDRSSTASVESGGQRARALAPKPAAPLRPEVLRGSLYDDSRAPVAAFTVVAETAWFGSNFCLRAPGTDPVRREVHDAEGRFALDGLAAREWSVHAETPEGLRSESVRLTLPGDGASLELVIVRATRLTVTVVDARGEALSAYVSVLDAEGRELLWRWAVGPGFGRSSSAALCLAPGEYRVVARDDEDRSVSADVHVAGQPTERLQLVFERR